MSGRYEVESSKGSTNEKQKKNGNQSRKKKRTHRRRGSPGLPPRSRRPLACPRRAEPRPRPGLWPSSPRRARRRRGREQPSPPPMGRARLTARRGNGFSQPLSPSFLFLLPKKSCGHTLHHQSDIFCAAAYFSTGEEHDAQKEKNSSGKEEGRGWVGGGGREQLVVF